MYFLVLIILGSIAYVIYARAPRIPAAVAPTVGGTQMMVATVFDDTATYHIEVRYPQFGIPSVDEKIKAAVDTALTEFRAYPANPLAGQALESATPKNEFTGSFDAVYVGPEVVSVELLLSEYTGGAHPNTAVVSVNIDLKTGSEITLDDALARIGRTLPQVATQSLAQLKAAVGEDIIFPEGAGANPDNYGTFLIGTSTVTFVFQNYQVAPYAAGIQKVSFPLK